MNKSTVK